MNQFDFSNKTILVTGGTRGIGKQIVKDLHELGANLLITGTKSHELNLLNNEATELGYKKKYFLLDSTLKISVNNFLEEIKKYKKIDCLVNNAGINRLNFIQDAKLNDWEEMMSVNLTAPFRILNIVSSLMIENGYGRVVNIASIFGVISKEKRALYSATKFGIHGLTVGCSNDLAKHDILVNTVSPGFVLTDMTKENLSPEEMKALASQIPIKRMAEVTELSNVVVFLLSDLNKYLTGQNIIVDGGFTNV